MPRLPGCERWIYNRTFRDRINLRFLESTEDRADLETFLGRLAQEAPGRYVRDAEGPDDMPTHIRAALTQTRLSVPVVQGRPVLGPWQGIYPWEHRTAAHRRDIVLHLIGA